MSALKGYDRYWEIRSRRQSPLVILSKQLRPGLLYWQHNSYYLLECQHPLNCTTCPCDRKKLEMAFAFFSGERVQPSLLLWDGSRFLVKAASQAVDGLMADV